MTLTIILLWIGGFNVMAAVAPGGPPWWLSLVTGVVSTLAGIVRMKQ